jgi:GNAT superfamily N-acetyltransferase
MENLVPTTDPIAVRLAVPQDSLALARLRYDFRSALGTPEEQESVFVDRCQRWMMPRLRDDSDWKCWVAVRDDDLVGNIWVELLEKIPNPVLEAEWHAYITNLFVVETARNGGIGSMLLSVALQWCRDRGVHAVLLWPTPESRSLYTRYGFAPGATLMEMVVTPIPGSERPDRE